MASPSPNNTGFVRGSTTFGDFNNVMFAVNQAIYKLQTVTLVRVESCTNDGELSAVGFVDVTPLVMQVDGTGNPTPHAIIHNLPYQRMQGGTSAFIIDPQPGDIGIALFCSRDISKVKATRAESTPGSSRKYDFSDGLYLGGVLNGEPQQYIRMSADGIEIVSPNMIRIQAPDVTVDGTLTVTGDVLSGTPKISLQQHKHLVGTTPTSPPQPQP